MNMIEVTIQNYLSLFPYLVGGGIVFNIWSEIAEQGLRELGFWATAENNSMESLSQTVLRESESIVVEQAGGSY